MRRLVILLTFLSAAGLPAAAAGQATSSPNVEVVATVPELATAIATNFIGDTMFVSTTIGVYSYDVSDPSAPRQLDAIPMYIWENEDMDVDVARKRIFVSRDPRGFTSPAAPGSTFPYGAVHIIDVADPANMVEIGFFTLPAGHTSTCVNACDFLWTAGPGSNPVTQPSDWVGRPVFATDVTDPANPVPCPDPIDLGRNDGVTDYAHDVQVDAQGVAWVSGAGGVRGYWTSGSHRNPLTGATEAATGCKPIPYAGSGTPEAGTPSRFMHNSWREPGAPPPPTARAARSSSGPVVASASAKRKAKRKRCSTKRGSRKARRRCAAQRRRARNRRKKPAVKKPLPIPTKPLPVIPARTMGERVLYGTEENITTDCATSGRFVTYDLEGTFDGEGFRDTAATKHRMKVLDTWTPEAAEGASGCDSAHYFASRGDGVFANAFYGQGLRFLDVSDPGNLRQIGWYRPTGANTWAAYWHKGLVYFTDNQLGVHILRFKGSSRSRTVAAPPLRNRGSALRFDRHFLGGLCPLPV